MKLTRHARGFTVPEVLVASFIISLIGAMLAMVLNLTKAQSYRTEAVVTSRQTSELLMKSLKDELDKSNADGVYIASDGKSFSLQSVDRISANASKAWSPFVTFFLFDQEQRRLLKGRVELSEIGETHQPEAPALIEADDLEKMIALRRADGKLRPVGSQVDNFEVSRPTAQTVALHTEILLKSGKYRNEKLETNEVFFFATAADL